MKITDAIYTYDFSEQKKDKILKKIKYGKKVRNLFLVCLPVSGPFSNDGILEIYEYKQLLQPYYKKISDEIYVVGIAKNKNCALDMVQNIIQDMYDVFQENDSENMEIAEAFNPKLFFQFAG